MNPQGNYPRARSNALRLARLAWMAILAASFSGCCCLDCLEHHTAMLKYVPHRSALKPRNPPCGYVEPSCYGYHATCWHTWPADCDPQRDCWLLNEAALPLPGKGPNAVEPMPPMPPAAPMPAAPDNAPTPANPPAPGEEETSSAEAEYYLAPASVEEERAQEPVRINIRSTRRNASYAPGMKVSP